LINSGGFPRNDFKLAAREFGDVSENQMQIRYLSGELRVCNDLKNLSARRETGDVELLKIGETSFIWQSRDMPGEKSPGKV
jgi:hypothetical protein